MKEGSNQGLLICAVLRRSIQYLLAFLLYAYGKDGMRQ